MDDIALHTRAWLAFALGIPSSARILRKLRTLQPDPSQIGHLLNDYLNGCETHLPETLASESSACDLTGMRSALTKARIQSAIDWANASEQHHLLTMEHRSYPALLRDTTDAPPVLYATGCLAALELPLLATVGSRKASQSAIHFTRTACSELADMGLGIVSGLARGIDAAAHEGALDAKGITIAVAATAPDTVYPRMHVGLARRITENKGLILTEYPLGSTTRPWFFPQRNRIISGVSIGLLITEAALPSGTLTTATHAMNQGREIMAVPGSVHNLQSRGCHALIKDGAALVENTQDILDVIGTPLHQALTEHSRKAEKGAQRATQHAPAVPATPVQIQLALTDPDVDPLDAFLLQQLNQQPATLDELVILAQQKYVSTPVSKLSSALGILEIRGLVTTSPGGHFTCQ